MLPKLVLLAALLVVAMSLTGVGPDLLRIDLPGAGYRYGSEWSAYLAPEAECPGGEDGGAPEAEQRQTVLCLVNWARAKHGLQPLPASALLMQSSATKASDMIRCDDFAHDACGVAFEAGARARGHQGSLGENIAWGRGLAGAPRPTVDGWLHSPEHRSNLLDPRWRVQGIALLRATRYQGAEDAAVWVSQFG